MLNSHGHEVFNLFTQRRQTKVGHLVAIVISVFHAFAIKEKSIKDSVPLNM